MPLNHMYRPKFFPKESLFFFSSCASPNIENYLGKESMNNLIVVFM